MQAIYDSGAQLKLVATLPDSMAIDKSGRVYVDDFCASHEISLVKSKNINDQLVVDAIKTAKLDWLFIIGWSQIARKPILDAPLFGVIGAHPTLLPIGRGRAAIPWAILRGHSQTGVTLFKIDEGIDSGPILAQQVIPISKNETASSLYEKVDEAHVEIIHDFIPHLLSNDIQFREQSEALATVWPGRSPADGEISLSSSVWDADRLVRAVTRPYPGAFFYKGDKKVIVWKASVTTDESKTESFIKFTDGYLNLIEYDVLWQNDRNIGASHFDGS